MRIAGCSAAFIIAVILVAPAHTQTPPPAAGTACALLTKEDAAAALGEPVTGPHAAQTPNGPSACEYSGSGLHKVNLSIIPLTGAQADVYKALCAQKKKDGLTGLGDTTCWYDDRHEELQVLKGTTFFTIEMRAKSDPTEPIKAVARKVYERMK